MNTLENEQEKSRFTTFEEIKDIKILSTEEISKLSEARQRYSCTRCCPKFRMSILDSKYIENRKKIIISSLLVIALFILIVATIAILIYKILHT